MTTCLAKRLVLHPNFEGRSLQKVDGLVKILYIFYENTGENLEVMVSVNDESPFGKKMKEAMLAKEKSIVLENVRLYIQNMKKGGSAKDDLEFKNYL